MLMLLSDRNLALHALVIFPATVSSNIQSIITLPCLISEFEITVGHCTFSDFFRDLAEQIQFARTNLLHIFNGQANNSL